MHHRPAGPPLSARIAGAATRSRLRTSAALSRGRGRLGLAVVLMALMTGFVLAAPVVPGADAPSGAALDASAQRSDAPVVMGVDGLGSSAFASASARLTIGPEGVRVEASGRSAAERSRAADVAAAAPPPAPVTTPAETPAPA
ncbi:hypothetical protein, partial [Candidatus Blastococcus massiliensis]|uniref:hypothetical protein n=1 Tax=Candidatus Blastococcus massiliensis TaxID=1470358 RepID=UPI0018CBF216